jgi:arylsulfatase A-like enzyme/Flp pilus assembly protein TadD
LAEKAVTKSQKAKTKQRFRVTPVAVETAAVVAAALVALIWWNATNASRTAIPPRHVLLITIDTLRADALGAYGNSAAATPWLDRLAAGGIRFDNARAHNVVTLPSHANILTGRLPIDHGVRDNAGFRVPATEKTVTTELKGRGFRTAAFVSAFPLDSRFGLARGFDVYDDRFVDATPRPAFLEQERSGVETVAAARRWIQEQPSDARWFCWVHLFEPHFPYAPPEPFASRFSATPYAGEVAATDAALGPLLQPILDAGAATDTLVIVTADHGESLGEHEEMTHGIFAYEATLRVPLLLYYPSLLQPRVSAATARHVDILPTIFQALEIPAPSALRGRSLIKPSRGQPEEDVTYFEALSGSLNRGWAPLTGVVSKGVKYIDLPIPELYELSTDAAERRNLAADRPGQLADLQGLVRSFPSGEVQRAAETSEVRDRLRSLGYVASDAGGARRKYSEADDPKRLIGYEARFQEVVRLYMSGNLKDAVAPGRALVAERPDMRVALLQLAHLEREAGDLPAAIDSLRRAIEINAGDTEAAAVLGAYLTTANRPQEAVEVLRPLANQSTPDVQVLVAFALAQARTGATTDALATLERARAEDPSNAMLLVDVGTIELMAGRRPQAQRAFEAALRLNPGAARAHSSLAAMAADDGRLDESLSHWRKAVELDPSEQEKLLAVGLSLARSGRAAEARPYIELFANTAPSPRYEADVSRAREWLRNQR